MCNFFNCTFCLTKLLLQLHEYGKITAVFNCKCENDVTYLKK